MFSTIFTKIWRGSEGLHAYRHLKKKNTDEVLRDVEEEYEERVRAGEILETEEEDEDLENLERNEFGEDLKNEETVTANSKKEDDSYAN